MNYKGEPVHVGRDFGRRDVEIDAALVEEYCRALEVEPSLYRSAAPALLLHSECYRDLDWYLANLIGNLHARQEWELFHAARVGHTVSTRGFIRERYNKRGRDYVVKETWVLDDSGLLLSRGLTHQSFLSQEVAGDVVSKDREKRPDRRFEIGEQGGRRIGPLRRHVDESMCMRFSGPTRNYHTDRQEARNLGFPDIVVQGMLPICLISELLFAEFGEGWLGGGKMDVRLVNVLWANESVGAHAEETEESREAGRRRVHMDVWVEKEDGAKVIVGRASALR
ncbi:MAG: hypothetical protein E4H03_03320 [Myxococcales bacterium]|nr:MAG: hypothetical protein E4H03_03320 [Myxococcales bacterium]